MLGQGKKLKSPKNETQDISTEISRILVQKLKKWEILGAILGLKSKFPMKIEVFEEICQTLKDFCKNQAQNISKTQGFGISIILGCRKNG